MQVGVPSPASSAGQACPSVHRIVQNPRPSCGPSAQPSATSGSQSAAPRQGSYSPPRGSPVELSAPVVAPVEDEVKLPLVVGVGGAPVSDTPSVALPEPELADVLGSGGIGVQAPSVRTRSALVLGFTLGRYPGE